MVNDSPKQKICDQGDCNYGHGHQGPHQAPELCSNAGGLVECQQDRNVRYFSGSAVVNRRIHPSHRAHQAHLALFTYLQDARRQGSLKWRAEERRTSIFRQPDFFPPTLWIHNAKHSDFRGLRTIHQLGRWLIALHYGTSYILLDLAPVKIIVLGSFLLLLSLLSPYMILHCVRDSMGRDLSLGLFSGPTQVRRKPVIKICDDGE